MSATGVAEPKKASGGAPSAGPHAALPLQKVRAMMKGNERVANVTTEAAHVMTKATEHFIGWLTKKAMANKDVRDRKKVCLNYQDLTPLLEQNPEQLEFATDLLPLRRAKWEHLGMQGPKGPKPAASALKPKSRPRPSGGKSKAARPNQGAADKEAPPCIEAGSTSSAKGTGAQALVRKSQGEGGSSKKRAKKNDGDEGARHGDIGGLLDDGDDEDSADRRAVDELVQAAVGHPAPAKDKLKPKNGASASRKRPPGVAAAAGVGAGGGLGGAGLEPLGGAGSSVLAGSPLRGVGGSSLLSSLNLGNLGGLQLQHLQEYQEIRKRMEQQALVQQALQLAAQRMQHQQGAAGAASADVGLPSFSLQQPPQQLAGNGAAALAQQQQQQGGAGFPLQAGLAQFLSMPMSTFSVQPQPQQNFSAALAVLSAAAAAAQAAQANSSGPTPAAVGANGPGTSPAGGGGGGSGLLGALSGLGGLGGDGPLGVAPQGTAIRKDTNVKP